MKTTMTLRSLRSSLMALCALLLLLWLLPMNAHAAEVVASGYCGGEGDGTNLTWTLDSNGTLTISGSGKMKDYGNSSRPWYSYREDLKALVIEEGVTSIGSYAFNGCTSLTGVDLPDGLTTIASYAFQGCTGFTDIRLPDSITTIWGSAFKNCTNLQSINIPLNWTSAGGSIFRGCAKLTSITVPEGITTLPENAFQGAEYLETVLLPSTLQTIGPSAFEHCTGLKNINFPSGVTRIGGYAFNGCTSLTGVDLPDGLTTIASYAFQGCTGLNHVTIPCDTCSIASNAFKNCPNVVIYSGIKSLVTVYAINNSFPFITTGSVSDLWKNVFEISNTSYFADAGGATANGCVTLTVEACVQEEAWENLYTGKTEIEIRIPDGTSLMEDTLRLNGSLCKDNFTLSDQKLRVRVTQRENTIRFSIRVEEANGDLVSYAMLSGSKGNAVIGIISEGLNVFALSTEEYTSRSEITVEGIAPPSSDVSLYVDGKWVKNLKTSKSGNYSGKISLGEVRENMIYLVSAACSGSEETFTASQQVTYKESAPALTEFKFYINNSTKAVDLYEAAQKGVQPSITHTGSKHPYKFVINFENSQSIDKLYVTSTRSNVKKSIEAKYDAAAGAFVAIGHFDENDHLYVPGTIGVEYTLKHEAFKVGQEIDWETQKSYISQNLRDNTAVTVESSGNKTTGTIDFSEVSESLANTALDYSIEYYDNEKGTALEYLKSLVGTEFNVFSYFVPGLDDSRYFVLLDFRDPSTYTVFVEDSLDVAQKVVEFKLSMSDFGNPQYTSLFDVSNSLSNFSTVFGVVSKTYGIVSDCKDLRSQVWQMSGDNLDVKESMRKIDELESDRIAFVLMTTALPLLVSGGVMTGPTILFGAMVGVMVSMSDIFWQLRVAEIKGESYKIKWHIDPSGYVYDVDSGLRIPDVTTTVYCIEYDDSDNFWDTTPAADTYGTKWDASEYNQENPLLTDSNGCYAWDVPEGWWRVKYEKDGYETVWSDWMPVPPPQTEVNIGMVSSDSAKYSLQLLDSSDTSSTVSLIDSSDSDVNILLVVAAFDLDGRMVSVSSANVTHGKTENTVLTVSYTSAVAIKAFVVNAKTMMPLRGIWVRDVAK